MEPRLPRPCNGVLAHLEQKYPLLGLRVEFAEKKEKTQLSGLNTGSGLRGMVKGRSHHTVYAVFWFVAAFFDRILGSVQQCDLARMNGLYTEWGIECASVRKAVRGWRVR